MPNSVPLPDALRAAVAGYDWLPATDGEGRGGGAVFRLAARGRPMLYLKCGRGDVAEDVAAEAARLRWLAGRVPVPEVIEFVHASRDAFLLTTAVAGRSAHATLAADPERRVATAAALGRFVRALHALPSSDCPFDAGHVRRLADARRNVDAGRVDASDFDAERAGWSAERVLAETCAMLPLPFERVVTHGDCTLDNVLLDGGRVAGCVDVGRAGVADPYQDLALLWRDLGEFGADAQQALLRSYGIAAPDERRLRFHLCLDELF